MKVCIYHLKKYSHPPNCAFCHVSRFFIFDTYTIVFFVVCLCAPAHAQTNNLLSRRVLSCMTHAVAGSIFTQDKLPNCLCIVAFMRIGEMSNNQCFYFGSFAAAVEMNRQTNANALSIFGYAMRADWRVDRWAIISSIRFTLIQLYLLALDTTDCEFVFVLHFDRDRQQHITNKHQPTASS